MTGRATAPLLMVYVPLVVRTRRPPGPESPGGEGSRGIEHERARVQLRGLVRCRPVEGIADHGARCACADSHGLRLWIRPGQRIERGGLDLSQGNESHRVGLDGRFGVGPTVLQRPGLQRRIVRQRDRARVGRREVCRIAEVRCVVDHGANGVRHHRDGWEVRVGVRSRAQHRGLDLQLVGRFGGVARHQANRIGRAFPGLDLERLGHVDQKPATGKEWGVLVGLGPIVRVADFGVGRCARHVDRRRGVVTRWEGSRPASRLSAGNPPPRPSPERAAGAWCHRPPGHRRWYPTPIGIRRIRQPGCAPHRLRPSRSPGGRRPAPAPSSDRTRSGSRVGPPCSIRTPRLCHRS